MTPTNPIQSEAGPSLEKFLSRHGLRAMDLDRECYREIRDAIADELGADWEMTGRCLEFTSDELRDINRENSSQSMCRVALLDAWSKREGKGATFLKLAGALQKRKRRDLIELLCTKLKSTLSLVPVSWSINGRDMPSGNDQLQSYREKYDDQTGQDSPSKPSIANFVPNEDIQFGYHSASGRQIRITNDGLRAERKGPHTVADDGVAYGARPLKGLAEFEVKIVSYWAKCASSIQLGVMRCKKGALIEPGTSIYQHAVNHCVWGGQQLFNNLVTPSKTSDYGYVELGDVHVGDCVGLRVSEDGSLELFVNSKSQGIAIRNIYTRKSDIYPVVDHRCDSAATVITKAVTQCDDIDLQEICLEKLSGWFKSGDEVDRLPLPTRLKDKLKSYMHE